MKHEKIKLLGLKKNFATVTTYMTQSSNKDMVEEPAMESVWVSHKHIS
jgi:hypothetical protein